MGDKENEVIFSVAVISASWFMTMSEPHWHIAGFLLYIIGNLSGIVISLKKSLKIMVVQYIVLTGFCVMGIINRLA